MSRGFTYIDDIVEIIIRLCKKPAFSDKLFKRNNPNFSSSWCPHRVFNIGNETSIKLEEFITCLEQKLGLKAIREYDYIQKGDVENTLSDNKLLNEWIGTYPKTNLDEGVDKFIQWFKEYYQ